MRIPERIGSNKEKPIASVNPDDVQDVRNADFVQLKRILGELLVSFDERLAVRVLSRIMDSEWIRHDESVGPMSWQRHSAQRALVVAFEEALRSDLNSAQRAEAKVYERLAEAFLELSRHHPLPSMEWGQDLLTDLLSGVSAKWLLDGAVDRLCGTGLDPDIKTPYSSEGGHRAYHRILDWLAAYRAVIFSERASEARDELVTRCSLGGEKFGSGDSIRLLRGSVFGPG